MASTVYVFNPASFAIDVVVNNGAQFRVPAATAASWAPGAPSANPTFTGNQPRQGQFGYGQNYCSITPAGSPGTATAIVTVPNSINPTDTIQLYLYCHDASTVNWVLLDNGVAVAGNLKFPPR